MKYTYLLIDSCAALFPVIFTFHPKLRFDRTWKAFWPSTIIVAAFFILWDLLYTKIGVWNFNRNYVTGIYFFNLPIEECMFFIFIPYACVFTYHCFTVLITADIFLKIRSWISILLIVFLLPTALFFHDRLYTAATFVSLALFIFFLQFVFKVKWLSGFYFTYLILLVPFLIVNGILTGTFIAEPVVLYNNKENIGIRILTIPVEDIFYGMLLILFNVGLYESFLLKMKSFNNRPMS